MKVNMKIFVIFFFFILIVAGAYALHDIRNYSCKADKDAMRATAVRLTPFNLSVREIAKKNIGIRLEDQFPDCCVVREYGGTRAPVLDEPRLSLGPISKEAFYYVQIPFKYAGDDLIDIDGIIYREPYLVEFDRCGSLVFNAFPYGD